MLSGKDMPKTPKGHKRPADVIANAVQVMRLATGEADEPTTDDGKNPAAVALGRRGGAARAKKLSKSRLQAIARKAAERRWAKNSKPRKSSKI